MSELSITTTNILAQCGWVAFSYLYISIGEHQIHKRLMHDKPLSARVYEASPCLLDAFDAHATRHHRKWYKAFDYEPDPRGREENLPIPMKETILMLVAAFPLWSPIFLFSIRGGCIFLATALLHNRLWSVFHRQMHIPRRVFYQDCAFFRFLAANHFLHHQDNRRNFNVVFPFADFLFGTWATPTRADLQELLRLGYVKPRSNVARAVVEKRREATALQRAQPALRSCEPRSYRLHLESVLRCFGPSKAAGLGMMFATPALPASRWLSRQHHSQTARDGPPRASRD